MEIVFKEQGNLFSHPDSFKFLSSLAIPCRLYAVEQIHSSLLTSAEYIVTANIGFEGNFSYFVTETSILRKPWRIRGNGMEETMRQDCTTEWSLLSRNEQRVETWFDNSNLAIFVFASIKASMWNGNIVDTYLLCLSVQCLHIFLCFQIWQDCCTCLS